MSTFICIDHELQKVVPHHEGFYGVRIGTILIYNMLDTTVCRHVHSEILQILKHFRPGHPGIGVSLEYWTGALKSVIVPIPEIAIELHKKGSLA
jgi:hypothetical protein